ncbi:MAG: hypothetical protein ACTSQI_08930 [Candidatus Helarchaeota archaeon]
MSLEVNDFEIIWLYIFDSGRWIKRRDEIKSIAKKLFDKLHSFEGVIHYFTPKEIEQHPEKKKKAFFYSKSKKIQEILDLFYDLDTDNVDPEYLENRQFFRAKLTDIKIVLPDNRIEPIKVQLLFHRSGVFTLEFSLELKDMALTPDMINELQLLPREEEEITFQIPRKLLQDYALINPEIATLLKNSSAKKENYLKLNLTFHELVWIYWAITAYIATDEKAKDSKSLRALLRYNVFHFFPLLLFNFPEDKTVEDIFGKYKSELYSMLTQEIYLKPEHLRPDIIDQTFNSTNNLADRVDYALYFSMESCINLYTEQSKPNLEYIAGKKKISFERQILFEKFEILLVLEFMQIQRFILLMFDHILSQKSISEMETDELAQMRARLSKVIEEFHNIKLMVKTSAIHRCEKGRETFEIEKSLDALEKKLEFVDTAVNSIHNNLMEFLSILIGLLVTIGPIIALSIGADYPIIASFVMLGALIAVYFAYKLLFKLWYRRQRI